MDETLTIRVANEDERRAAHGNVHDVWSRGLPVEELARFRMASPLHRRATWYVGLVNDRVVTGLGSHPILYRVRGEEVRGIGIAAVHTLPDFRGRGFAPRVIEFAEQDQRASGMRMSMLFSDVDPAYYGRIGYQRCPAHHALVRVSESAAEEPLQLKSFDPLAEVSSIRELYHSAFRNAAFAIIRTEEYSQHLIARSPQDEFLWLIDDQQRAGYARVRIDGKRMQLREAIVANDEPRLRIALYRQIALLAKQRELPQVEGWLPNDSASREVMHVEPRVEEITMLKSLDPSVSFDESCLQAADRLNEIDHV